MLQVVLIGTVMYAKYFIGLLENVNYWITWSLTTNVSIMMSLNSKKKRNCTRVWQRLQTKRLWLAGSLAYEKIKNCVSVLGGREGGENSYRFVNLAQVSVCACVGRWSCQQQQLHCSIPCYRIFRNRRKCFVLYAKYMFCGMRAELVNKILVVICPWQSYKHVCVWKVTT